MPASATSLYGLYSPARRRSRWSMLRPLRAALPALALLGGCADRTTAPSDGVAAVSATIDGSAWRADPGASSGSFGAGPGSSALAILGSRCIPCRPLLGTPAPDTLEGLQLVITRFTGPGTYVMSPGTTADAAAAAGVVTRIVLGTDQSPPSPSPEVFRSLPGGRIVVNGFDPFAGRASGTFVFEAADSAGGIRHIRDGAFDVPLYDQPPPLRARIRPLPSVRP